MSDDTQYVQFHIDSRLEEPLRRGPLRITETLRLTQSYGYKLTGNGGPVRNEAQAISSKSQATSLIWEGSPGKPVFEILGNTGLVIEGVNIIAGTASHGYMIRDAGGSLNMAFRDLGIIGGNVGLQCGVSSGEQTCANITYDNVHWQEQREACVRLTNMQSLEHLFQRPKFALAPIGIDVVSGGDVSIVGGGSYEINTLLKITSGGRNCRGFDVSSFRFDGKRTRTSWIDYDNPTRVKTVGPVTFANCSQNNGQMQSTRPLLTACPGARVVARECSFDGGYDNWAEVYSDRIAGGEMIIENCDGLNGIALGEYVTCHGGESYAEFRHCGTLYGPVGSWSNFPDQPEIGPPQFTADEADILRKLLLQYGVIDGVIRDMGRIHQGQLRATFQE